MSRSDSGRRVTIRGLSLLVALGVASPAMAAPIRVLLIGDSITRGRVSGPEGPAYAELLPSLLGEGYEVTNIGTGGASSLDWTLSCPGTPWNLFPTLAVPNLPSEVVSILLGTNDAIAFYEPEPVSVELYRLAIEEIVENLFAEGAGIVILMTPPDHIGSDPTSRDRLIGYREEILLICSQIPGVVCGPDLFTSLDLDLHFEDGDTHPNAQGHLVIANSLSETVVAIPEPESGLLAVCGLVALAVKWRWSQRHA
jgi:lysophospholipase L1-like esterase